MAKPKYKHFVTACIWVRDATWFAPFKGTWHNRCLLYSRLYIKALMSWKTCSMRAFW
jgi:hypothetical protein